jgi:thiamine pyrophosphokinase
MTGSAAIVLNGTGFCLGDFLELCKKNCTVVAVDGGISHLKGTGVIIDIHIGDMDSCPDDCGQFTVSEELSYPQDKDLSDFELSLKWCSDNGITDVSVFAAAGGRADHFLSNYETAVRFCKDGMDLQFLGRNENIYFLNRPRDFNFPAGSTVSVFSGTQSSDGVSLDGFKYGLKDFCLKKAHPLGLSNTACSYSQKISFKSGVLAVILNRKDVDNRQDK